MQLDLESGTADRPLTARRHSHFRQSLKTFLFGQWVQSAVWIPLYLRFRYLTNLLPCLDDVTSSERRKHFESNTVALCSRCCTIPTRTVQRTTLQLSCTARTVANTRRKCRPSYRQAGLTTEQNLKSFWNVWMWRVLGCMWHLCRFATAAHCWPGFNHTVNLSGVSRAGDCFCYTVQHSWLMASPQICVVCICAAGFCSVDTAHRQL